MAFSIYYFLFMPDFSFFEQKSPRKSCLIIQTRNTIVRSMYLHFPQENSTSFGCQEVSEHDTTSL